MILYAVILFLTALLFGWLAWQISRGNTRLIHDYHQTHVTDRKSYAKAIGKGIWIISISAAASGAVSLFGSENWMTVGILLVGLVWGLAVIVAAQKRYNGGIF